MTDPSKMQELDPDLVKRQYGKKEGLTDQEKTAAIAFSQVAILSSARTAIYFELTLRAVIMMNMSPETIDVFKAVVNVCRDSLTDPQAKDIYEKALVVALSDSSVNLMHTAISFHLHALHEAKEKAERERQDCFPFDP